MTKHFLDGVEIYTNYKKATPQWVWLTLGVVTFLLTALLEGTL